MVVSEELGKERVVLVRSSVRTHGIGETVEYMPSSRRRWKHCWSAQSGLRWLESKTASCDIESHQFSGEPKMRFVSTALVMMTIALMLLALMLLTPTVRANPSLAPTLVIVKP
jgi:hypothetical protein